MNAYQPWLNWAVELQSLAQAGLHYSKDPFDVERFQRIREISAEMIALKSGLPEATVQNLFCGDSGYQTPKLDVRCAVFQEGRILLVRENEGRWTLPGGWMDVGLTVGENAAKEARERPALRYAPAVSSPFWTGSAATAPPPRPRASARSSSSATCWAATLPPTSKLPPAAGLLCPSCPNWWKKNPPAPSWSCASVLAAPRFGSLFLIEFVIFPFYITIGRGLLWLRSKF